MGKRLKPNRSTAKIVPFIQSGDYYFKKGLRAYHRRDLYKAKKYFQRAVHLDAKEAMFACQLAVVLAELGEYQASNEWLLKVVRELDPDMNECFYFLANNYAHLGLFREALRHAQTYLEREPDGGFADDVEDLIDLLSIEHDDEIGNQDDLIMKQERARSLLEKGEFAAAIGVLEAIIADYPEFWSAYNNLALAYFYMGDAEKAQTFIDEVLEKNPGNLHALCNRLVFSYYLRDDANVRRFADELACVHPILLEHRYKLGATFALVGRFDLAFKWLRHLYKIRFDGDFLFYYWLACASHYTGHEQLAKTAWEKAIELNPDKKGQEPWGDAMDDNIERWTKGSKVPETLYGLYLMSKSLNAEEVEAYGEMRGRMLNHPLVEQFADYVLASADAAHVPAYIEDAYSVMDELRRKNRAADEDMYVAWFEVFANAWETAADFSNCKAWAAAMEYVWRRKKNDRVTQKAIAEKYGISAATVQKYAKKVRQWLP